MAEPTDSRKLSGLARSIDSLFAAPAATVPAAAVTLLETPAAVATPVDSPADATVMDAPVSLSVTQVTPLAETPPPVTSPESFEPPPAVPPAVHEPEPPELPRLDMFPSTQMFDAIKAPSEPVAPEPVAVEPSSSAALASEEPPMELAPARPEGTALRVAHGPEGGSFAREVDAYLGGDPSARARAEALAAELQDRLELDPLADAVEKIVRAAGDPPSSAHLDFVRAVIDPAVASRLVQRLGQEGDEAGRQEYFALCRRLGPVMANAIKGALTGALEKDVRRTYYDALISMGDSVRPMIEGMVADDNRFLVRDGVAILGEIGGPRAVEVVTSSLADNDYRVRAEALHALGKLGDAKSGQLVLGFLEDTSPEVRLAAAEASGRLGLERAVRPVLHLLEGAKKEGEVVALLRALGQIGDPGAVPAIEKHAVPSLLSKPTTEVRVAAYRALHAIGTPHARDLVRQTQQDKDPGVRAALRDLARQA